MFSVARLKDGDIDIGVAPIKPADMTRLKQLGIQIKATQKASGPSGGKLVATHATTNPFLGFGCHGWDIGGLDASREMVVVPADQ